MSEATLTSFFGTMRLFVCSFFLSSFLACALIVFSPRADEAPGKRAVATLVEMLRSPLDDTRCQGRPPLCRVFLGERDALPTEQRQIFQRAGLAHLIALSGGQTAPLAAVVAACVIAPFVLCVVMCVGAKKALKTRAMLRHLHKGVHAATATLAAFLYGASGALLRVPFLSVAVSVFPRSMQFSASLKRGIGLFVLSFLIGNPFADPSFLLSCIGCEAVLFAGLGANALRSRGKQEAFSLMPDVLFRAVSVTVLTSLVMSIGLAGFMQRSPARSTPADHPRENAESTLLSAQANLVAVPFVTWVITPLSVSELVSAATQADGQASRFLSARYDDALVMLELLAKAFAPALPQAESPRKAHSSSSSSPVGLFAMLRKKNGSLPFALFLALLWSLRDTLEGRRTRALRREFGCVIARVSRQTLLH
ncbi:MAG: ComEC/Rec2 family competence protein [Silvanigrellales bacterium]|nr:ComEC/Rec2 family competence protein [Silvanigrellales bacterium]